MLKCGPSVLGTGGLFFRTLIMRRLFILLLIPASVSCAPENPIESVVTARNGYGVEVTNLINRPDENKILIEFNVINSTPSRLDHLTVLMEQLDADENVLDKSRHVLDVSELGYNGSMPILKKIERASDRVQAVSCRIEKNPDRKAMMEMKEFEGLIR